MTVKLVQSALRGTTPANAPARRVQRDVTARLAFLYFVTIRLFAQSIVEIAPAARVIVGWEQSATLAATPVHKLAINLAFAEPLSPRVAAWGDLRLSSLPRAMPSTVATLPADVVKLVATVPLSELVRSGEFLVGLSYRVSGGQGPWSTWKLIASMGAAVPLDPAQTRFYRQYYGGLRLQSTRQTHVVDVTLGQNETATGGRFAGAVMRVDGFYALPVSSGSFLYLFGTAILRTSPTHSDNPAKGNDTYRIGVGVDFFQMLKALRSN